MTLRSSMGSSSSITDESTEVLACSQDGAGKAVTTSPSATTSYALPGTLTPNSNTGLSTSLSYTSSWAVTTVTDPNGAQATTTYDSYGRQSQSTIPDGAQTSYTYTYYPGAAKEPASEGGDGGVGGSAVGAASTRQPASCTSRW